MTHKNGTHVTNRSHIDSGRNVLTRVTLRGVLGFLVMILEWLGWKALHIRVGENYEITVHAVSNDGTLVGIYPSRVPDTHIHDGKGYKQDITLNLSYLMNIMSDRS